MNEARTVQIVVIDDDSHHLDYVVTLLRRAHHACVGFTDARAALDYMKKAQVALVITDIFMPGMDGFEILRTIRSLFPRVFVVTLSGETLSGESKMTEDFYLDCTMHLGAVAALRKPFEPEDLRTIVEQCLAQWHASAPSLPQEQASAREHGEQDNAKTR